MDKKLKLLVLDRATWARGGKNGKSALLNSDGAMCCLGFLACDLGATKRQIRCRDLPSETSKNLVWPSGLFTQRNSMQHEVEDDIAEINDDPTTSDSEKLSLLRPKFRKLGYRLTLKGTDK